MVHTCSRCGAPAGTVMSFDYQQRAVWLDDLQEAPEPGAAYAFCATHGDRMTPPLGWTLLDRRRTIRLFAPLEVA